ncbi:uncharacterized protein LOC107426629 isoform X2 [Ziziphus jujuba]|uniref:Uncharacterized protein LOC107426629 isoform X2 n=1 Tax=Ziziphus jujuba TaxID=326968 RepID=A0A6P4AT08_ZIZJJ|nr:uncharacterized protein LOC107426629 isoform X2 [Ziziphus jujuba]
MLGRKSIQGCYVTHFIISASFRFSTASEVQNESTPESDFVSFIKSTVDELEGPSHCWLTKFGRYKSFPERDGTFLVLAGQFLETTGCEPIVTFEKVKLLQQRFPQLYVIGFQPGSAISSSADRSDLIQLMVKEYITFPILLSSKNFSELANGICYILFKDFKSPVFFHDNGLDLQVLNKALEELNVQQNGNSKPPNNSKNTSLKQAEIIRESYMSSLQNFLFHFPGCVSGDEDGNRLFISDSNHHRIIIINGSGKILDCIGSSPGFEDGEFESAKFVRPAASFYHAAEDCLYFVDSENHAIRRADMERRVVETLCPASNTNKKNFQFWTWIMDKLGFGSNYDAKSVAVDVQSLLFPWHLIKSVDDSLLVIDRRFDTLWTIDLASGKVKEIIKGFPKILEICEQQLLEKVSLLKQIPQHWLQHQVAAICSPSELPYVGFMSSFTTLQNDLIICDMAGQRILKLSGESRDPSNFQFSNFGILGLPYWVSSSLEKVYTVIDGLQGTQIDHFQCFSLLPGKVDVQLNVDIPADTELVEQLQEGCIWRQARGAATEISGVEEAAESLEKVGVSQQWYDELDNLAFSTPDVDLALEDNKTTSDASFRDDRIRISSSVNTSPGTSEVIVNAVLYLKLRKESDIPEDDREKCAERIVDILSPQKSGKMARDSCIQYLLKTMRDLRDVIFTKPLHVRIKLDCLDHPKADNLKDIILTESSIEVNVSL